MSGFRVYQVEGSHLWAIGASYYSPKLNAAARSVPGTTWDSALKAHVGYIDAIEQVTFRLREMGLKSESVPARRPPKHQLLVSYDGARDYQKEGIDFLIALAGSGALLADDMGCVSGAENVTALYVDDNSSHRRVETVSLRVLYDRFKLLWYPRPRVWALCGDKFDFHRISDVVNRGTRDTVWLEFHTGNPQASCHASSLRLTPDHEVATPGGFRRADSLRAGDVILEDGHDEILEARVTAIRDAGPDHVYDIVCEDPHRNFVANGIIVHNCGKSLQAAKAARALRRKTVIVCPAHVRGVWERPADSSIGEKGGELAKWWPAASVFKPYGVKPSAVPSDVDVTVIHYDIIYAWVDALLEWAAGGMTIVLDESHILLNPTSRRSKACAELAANARGKIALTGTPPVERVKDLYGIVETISPGRFGDFFPYGRRFCGGKRVDIAGPDGTMKTGWDFNGKSNLPELRQRLDWFMLRRTKREVLKELPAMQRQIIDVEVPARNRIGMNARLVGDKRRMRMALDAAANGKFKSCLELVRGHLEAGQRVVIGTYRRAVCEKFADELSETAPTKFIHGGVALPRRGKILDELKEIEGPCCLVANIDATSTGVDFTFASIGVVAELVWEPRELVQWEARMHRYGASETEPVLIQYVIARGTGDELILQAVINKLDNFLELVETDDGDGMKEALVGKKDEGLDRLAAALKKMGEKAKRKR